jgi:hypothetical protein
LKHLDFRQTIFVRVNIEAVENETPRLPVTELREGDVLLLTGRSVFSRLVAFIEGTAFDHVAIVVPPNFEDPHFGRGSLDDRTNELWMVDVGFDGGRRKPLSAYDDRVLDISVRRHRLPGAGELAATRGVQRASEIESYAWDRLMFLSFIGMTRWSAGLTELSPPLAGAFMTALLELLNRVRIESTEGSKERRICSELIVEAFDAFEPAADRNVPYHFGLTIPPFNQRGLLWWASGVEMFDDFVSTAPPPRRASVLDNDQSLQIDVATAVSMLQELSFETGGSFPGLQPFDESVLRNVVIDSAERTLSQLLVDVHVGDLGAARDPRRVAWFLLDKVMRHRVIPTPADIGASKSLFDVGTLELGEISFRRMAKE